MIVGFFLSKSKFKNKLEDIKGTVKEGKFKHFLHTVYVIDINHDQTCSIVLG